MAGQQARRQIEVEVKESSMSLIKPAVERILLDDVNSPEIAKRRLAKRVIELMEYAQEEDDPIKPESIFAFYHFLDFIVYPDRDLKPVSVSTVNGDLCTEWQDNYRDRYAIIWFKGIEDLVVLHRVDGKFVEGVKEAVNGSLLLTARYFQSEGFFKGEA